MEGDDPCLKLTNLYSYNVLSYSTRLHLNNDKTNIVNHYLTENQYTFPISSFFNCKTIWGNYD